jgi:glycosyltransferase involved in cell wall biosynthesis
VRIAIDARKLHDYGIGTYVRNILRELARNDGGHTYVLLCRPQDAEALRAESPRFETLVEAAGNYSVQEQLTVPFDLWRARVDLFHAPHYVVSPLTPRPYVVTIHDCIHLRFPQYLPNRAAHLYARAMMTVAARRAKKILTVSHASKDDILHFLGVPSEKVEVIYNGLDQRLAASPTPDEIARVRDRFMLTSPFVLYTGNIKPHKNVDRLIEAYASLRQRGHEDVKLLIIGEEISRFPNLRRLVHRHQLHGHVRFFGFVPDATLSVLYRLASVFVFPSLYEGFGLPPLEAMAAGVPVITSNVSSLPEVVGDAALLIDPLDPDAIAAAMARVLSEPALRADMVRRGYERAKAFSWTRAVDRIRQVYTELGDGT